MQNEEMKKDVDPILISVIERQAEQRATMSMFKKETERRMECLEMRTEKILDELHALEGRFVEGLDALREDIASELKPLTERHYRNERELAIMAAKISTIVGAIMLAVQIGVKLVGKIL